MDEKEQIVRGVFGAFLFAASASAVGACTERLIELGWTKDQITERRQELSRAIAEITGPEVVRSVDRIAEIVGKSEPGRDGVAEFCKPFVAAGVRVANQIGGAE